MLSSINIGKRMGLAFATLVAIALALAGAGYWGLSNVAATAEHILTVDVASADTAGQVHAAALELRRYEKDYFLNIANPKLRDEYLQKWHGQKEQLLQRLDKLNGLLDHDSERTRAAGMRTAIAAYLGTGPAFEKAISDFAVSYADQNDRDYRALEAAVASGRIAAEMGV